MKQKVKEMEANMPESDNLPFDKIPPVADVEITKFETANDKNGKDCLFVTYGILNGKLKGKTFVTKYTTYHYSELIRALEAVGLDGFETGQKMHVELKGFSMGYPRHLPTELVD